MPMAQNRGYNIHYTVDGSGPLLVLQHGFLSNAQSWHENGYVDRLTDAFTVACVDSLGHGESDKPADAAAYHQSQRAADIVAVIDAIGAQQAHLLGYSMGGWLSVGVAKYYPERLASLMVCGWDVVNGMKSVYESMSMPPLQMEDLLGMAAQAAPDLVAWVTDDVKLALAPCFAQLYNLEGADAAVTGFPRPVMLWNGAEDVYHQTMQPYAEQHGFKYLVTPGDHIGAMLESADPVSNAIKTLVE